jgi:hypothetical protein
VSTKKRRLRALFLSSVCAHTNSDTMFVDTQVANKGLCGPTCHFPPRAYAAISLQEPTPFPSKSLRHFPPRAYAISLQEPTPFPSKSLRGAHLNKSRDLHEPDEAEAAHEEDGWHDVAKSNQALWSGTQPRNEHNLQHRENEDSLEGTWDDFGSDNAVWLQSETHQADSQDILQTHTWTSVDYTRATVAAIIPEPEHQEGQCSYVYIASSAGLYDHRHLGRTFQGDVKRFKVGGQLSDSSTCDTMTVLKRDHLVFVHRKLRVCIRRNMRKLETAEDICNPDKQKR